MKKHVFLRSRSGLRYAAKIHSLFWYILTIWYHDDDDDHLLSSDEDYFRLEKSGIIRSRDNQAGAQGDSIDRKKQPTPDWYIR